MTTVEQYDLIYITDDRQQIQGSTCMFCIFVIQSFISNGFLSWYYYDNIEEDVEDTVEWEYLLPHDI